MREIKGALPERFLARPGLRPSANSRRGKRRDRSPVTRRPRKTFWLRQKTGLDRSVEEQLPFNVFLAGEEKRNRFIMGVHQKQKRIVANRFTLKTEDINSVAAQHHSEATDENGKLNLRRSFRYHRD